MARAATIVRTRAAAGGGGGHNDQGGSDGGHNDLGSGGGPRPDKDSVERGQVTHGGGGGLPAGGTPLAVATPASAAKRKKKNAPAGGTPLAVATMVSSVSASALKLDSSAEMPPLVRLSGDCIPPIFYFLSAHTWPALHTLILTRSPHCVPVYIFGFFSRPVSARRAQFERRAQDSPGVCPLRSGCWSAVGGRHAVDAGAAPCRVFGARRCRRSSSSGPAAKASVVLSAAAPAVVDNGCQSSGAAVSSSVQGRADWRQRGE